MRWQDEDRVSLKKWFLTHMWLHQSVTGCILDSIRKKSSFLFLPLLCVSLGQGETNPPNQSKTMVPIRVLLGRVAPVAKIKVLTHVAVHTLANNHTLAVVASILHVDHTMAVLMAFGLHSTYVGPKKDRGWEFIGWDCCHLCTVSLA